MDLNSEIDSYIHSWILNVSEFRPELNSLSICPFAKQSKFKIIHCNISDIDILNDYDVIIFVVEDHLNLEDIEKWVSFYNNKHLNWKFFEDCKEKDSYINNVKTNNGKYNLVLAQPKEKLKKYRKILTKTNYYTYWNKDYLKEILDDDYDLIDKG